MSVCCAALMCHAPIVVPEVGGARGEACAQTTRAMEAVARQVVAHRPDVVVLLSPHTPRFTEQFGLFGARGLDGSFAAFAAPHARVHTRPAPAALELLGAAAEALGVPARSAALDELDHGAMVPLYFLLRHDASLPVALISLPMPRAVDADGLGRTIRRAAEAAGQRWAVIASGDMSHRLLPGAPSGYDPAAAQFDRRFVEHLRAGRYPQAVHPDRALRERAAEDVVDTTRAALAAVEYVTTGSRVYAYEGPFGVGYCEALLYTDTLGPRADGAPPVLLEVAREAIEAALHGVPYTVPSLPAPFAAPRAVFVTLRSPQGELRGCIGRTVPAADSLAAEVADCARGAALRDSRMAPVEIAELSTLRIEVSVLSEPEPVSGPDALDPRRYGVVVSDGVGRRGVLLPAIQGVESVGQQLAIARQKAGIEAQAPVSLARFRVDKVVEA